MLKLMTNVSNQLQTSIQQNTCSNQKNLLSKNSAVDSFQKTSAISFGNNMHRKEEIEQLSESAAVWWAEKLQTPKFDNGGTDPGNQLAQLITASMHKEQPGDKASKFKEALKEAIAERLEMTSYMSFGVDYHPDRILTDALSKATIKNDMSTLPWKTNMWIKDGKVEVRYGYGAPIEVVYDMAEKH